MNQKDALARIINATTPNDRRTCWCPSCDQDKRKVSTVGIWVSPVGVLVCTYGVCKECTDMAANAPNRLQSKVMDRAEQRLLAKYPELFKKLPSGYCVGGSVTRIFD